jgi:hypothetical protein
MGTERDAEFYTLLRQASGTLGLVWPLETAGQQARSKA